LGQNSNTPTKIFSTEQKEAEVPKASLTAKTTPAVSTPDPKSLTKQLSVSSAAFHESHCSSQEERQQGKHDTVNVQIPDIYISGYEIVSHLVLAIQQWDKFVKSASLDLFIQKIFFLYIK
jgi:hypothetical protein